MFACSSCPDAVVFLWHGGAHHWLQGTTGMQQADYKKMLSFMTLSFKLSLKSKQKGPNDSLSILFHMWELMAQTIRKPRGRWPPAGITTTKVQVYWLWLHKEMHCNSSVLRHVALNPFNMTCIFFPLVRKLFLQLVKIKLLTIVFTLIKIQMCFTF